MDWQTLFLKVEGRIGKKDFWIGIGILFLANIVFANAPNVIASLWSLASVYFGICVAGKRLHDLGKSAMFCLLPAALVILGVIVGFVIGGVGLLGGLASGSDGLSALSIIGGFGLGAIFMSLGSLAGFTLVVWLGIADGDATDNQFGPPRDVPLVTAV